MQIIIDVDHHDMHPDDLVDLIEENLEDLFEHEGISANIYIGEEED